MRYLPSHDLLNGNAGSEVELSPPVFFTVEGGFSATDAIGCSFSAAPSAVPSLSLTMGLTERFRVYFPQAVGPHFIPLGMETPLYEPTAGQTTEFDIAVAGASPAGFWRVR